MKKHVLLFLATFLMAATAFSQLRTIPASITEAFKKKFPNVAYTSWGDKVTSYEAYFTVNNEKMEAVFDSSGKWQKTGKYMDITKLPATVSTGFRNSAYSGEWIPKTAYEIENSNGQFEYRILIEKAGQIRKYLFLTKAGKVLQEAPAQ